jgi:probable phosphoglycerate mutase
LEIYLLRHGETVWNRQRRMQGRLDSPLTLKGIRQAEALGRLMRQLIGAGEGHRMLASPLPRAWQTAAIVAETMEYAADRIERHELLLEMTWGDWDGLTAEEITARDPELWQARIDDRWTVPPPGGGETQQDIIDRAARFLGRVEDGERLIVVAHGALGRAMRVAYQNAAAEEMLRMDEPHDAVFHLQNGLIRRYDSIMVVD